MGTREHWYAVAFVLAVTGAGLRAVSAEAGLVINEAMSCNTLSLADEDDDYEDWIEILNTGSTALQLLGCGLSDDPGQPFKWIFPSRMLAANGQMVVWASGKNRFGNNLHANFKLAGEGDTLLLTAPDGQSLDLIATGSMLADQSRGRAPDGTGDWLCLAVASPGAPNGSIGYPGYAAPLDADQAPGFRSLPLSVIISSPSPDAVLRYTLDASEPDSLSPLVTGPLPIAGTSVLRARGFEAGRLPGPILSLSWLFDEERSLPVLSLITDPRHLWDSATGIYVLGESYDPSYPYYGANFWEAWERPARLELYEADGSLALAQDIGIRIHGGHTRALPQKSLRLIARDGYGATRFDYRVFQNESVMDFKYLILRNAGNDWCHAQCRDGIIQRLVAPSGVDDNAYRPAVLFLNGEYWGVHNLRERVNANYVEDHYGWEEDEIDMIESYEFIMAGDDQHYQSMLDFIAGADLSDDADFAQLKTLMDTDEFLAYCVHEVFVGNYDWPGGNIKYWRPRTADGRWRWVLYDTDYGFGLLHDVTLNSLAQALDPSSPGWPNPPHSTYLLRSLMANADFQRDFINVSCELLSTRFQPVALRAAIDSTAAGIASEMAEHMPRWGYTVAEWEQEIAEMRLYADARPAIYREHLRGEFALGDSVRLNLAIAPSGSGSLRLTGLSVESPTSLLYFEGVPIPIHAVPKPGWAFDGWTGMNLPASPAALLDLHYNTQLTARFVPTGAELASAVINEITYNALPAHESGDWVELHNPGVFDLDLSGWEFRDESDAHSFSLPAGTLLTAGGYLVLCEDRATFLSQFPEVDPVPGELGFGFAGGGELLRLFDAEGQLYDAVLYDDAPPWPLEADGLGPSLELVHPQLDNSLGQSWAASDAGAPYGTPGARNSRFDGTDSAPPPALHRLALAAPQPNPFNPATTLRFFLPAADRVSLRIYAVDGREVARLVEEGLAAGWHARQWQPSGLVSGLYLAELRAGADRAQQKLLLLK